VESCGIQNGGKTWCTGRQAEARVGELGGPRGPLEEVPAGNIAIESERAGDRRRNC
jgi:hypothetical protein